MDYQDKWFKQTKKKLIKLISNEKWDYIDLTDLEYTVVTKITNSNSFYELPVNLRISFVNHIVESIENKLKNIHTL